MNAIIHISIPKFYEYNGWIFEYSRTKPFGPWPQKKDLTPRERCGKKFYKDIAGFFDLTVEEQEKRRV